MGYQHLPVLLCFFYFVNLTPKILVLHIMTKNINETLSLHLTGFFLLQVVNIYLNPKRLQSNETRRVCVYWQFMEDGTGYWSENGCVLVRSDYPGMLDMCQCNHLTHFTEILVPTESEWTTPTYVLTVSFKPVLCDTSGFYDGRSER